MPVPSASDSGKLRLGLRTSAAVKVTLFHASAEKSAPTMATPISVSVPILQIEPSGGYGCIVLSPAPRQKSVKFVERAMAVEYAKPSSTSAASEPTFATVKTFCTVLPTLRPRVLSHVIKTIDKIASRFWWLRPTLYGPSAPNQKCHGPIVPSFQIHAVPENHGIITAVNFANAMATAAIVAV